MADQSGVTWGVVLPHGAAGEFAAVSAQVAWARLRDSAVTCCDRLGYDHVWISDHLMASFGDRTGQQFEAYSTLAALTQVTERARLGVIVTCALYRSVAMLAKQAAGIDVMSDGRLIFALGAGWDQGEFDAFGYPFPSPGERVSVFEETLQAGHRELWSQPTVDFPGQHVRLAGALLQPASGRAATRVDGHPWAARTADRRQIRRCHQLERRTHRLPPTDRRAGGCVRREVGREPASLETSVFRLADLSGSRRTTCAGSSSNRARRPDLATAVGEEHFIGSVETQ